MYNIICKSHKNPDFMRFKWAFFASSDFYQIWVFQVTIRFRMQILFFYLQVYNLQLFQVGQICSFSNVIQKSGKTQDFVWFDWAFQAF